MIELAITEIAKTESSSKLFEQAQEISGKTMDVDELDKPFETSTADTSGSELPEWHKEYEASVSEVPEWGREARETGDLPEEAASEVVERPTPAESEQKAKEIYGGEEQKSYKDGEEVPYGTPGSTRPDLVVVDEEAGSTTAVEVKNYDLSTDQRVEALCKEIRRQVGERGEHMPDGTKQVICLDVRGQGLSEERIEEVKERVKEACADVYKDIPVDIID